MRGLILAVGFLTRLPTPRLPNFHPDELSRAAAWFPAVGALVGAIVAGVLGLAALVDPRLAALAGCVAWVWVTGALHLDGLADLADGLGAAHRDPARFLAVLRDPHTGTFGVVAIVLALAAKLVLLAILCRAPLWPLLLVTGWARLGPLVWAQTLPPLAPGSGERFAWQVTPRTSVAWALVLASCSLAVAPVLALAGPLALAAWWRFLKVRLGGMTGDCLGAGVELCELALLATLAVVA